MTSEEQNQAATAQPSNDNVEEVTEEAIAMDTDEELEVPASRPTGSSN